MEPFATARAAITDAETAYLDLKARYDALLNPPEPPPPPPPPEPPAPVPVPVPIPPNPSGIQIPTNDLPGWKLAWSEDFDKPAAKGHIRDVYGDKLKFYPPLPTTTYYPDTSHRGRYETDNIEAMNSCLRYHVHTTKDAAGTAIHHVACVLPHLSTLGQYGAVSGGRFAVRWRSDPLHTYKNAWLLWPLAGTNTKDAAGNPGGNGEIDHPECSLTSGYIDAYMHRQAAITGSDQDHRRSAALHLTDWHTCVIEWRMGKSCAFFVDDVQLGATITSRVPSTPMRWTLQTETSLDKTVPIDNAADGYVEIDWLAYWAPV